MLYAKEYYLVYGNKHEALKKACIAGGVICILFFIALITAGFMKNGTTGIKTAFRWPFPLFPIVAAFIPPLIVFPTILYSIRVEDGYIMLVYDNIRVLKEGQLDDLVGIELGTGLYAVILHFQDNSSIRFIGASVDECVRLAEDITTEAMHEIEIKARGKYKKQLEKSRGGI